MFEAPDSRAGSSHYTSGSSNYATVGRPVSLPLSRQQRLLSSSDPDLPSSNPASPDNDMTSYSGQSTAHYFVIASLHFRRVSAPGRPWGL